MNVNLKCPHCGGELIERTVEKLLRGGANTAVVKSRAAICLHCGERLYAPETVKLFEKVREKLERDDFSDLKPMGKSFQAAQA